MCLWRNYKGRADLSHTRSEVIMQEPEVIRRNLGMSLNTNVLV